MCKCNSALITTNEHKCLCNYLLQVQGWALTEYGDSLQCLVNTPSLNNKFIQCTFFLSDIITKDRSIHYILQATIISLHFYHIK